MVMKWDLIVITSNIVDDWQRDMLETACLHIIGRKVKAIGYFSEGIHESLADEVIDELDESSYKKRKKLKKQIEAAGCVGDVEKFITEFVMKHADLETAVVFYPMNGRSDLYEMLKQTLYYNGPEYEPQTIAEVIWKGIDQLPDLFSYMRSKGILTDRINKESPVSVAYGIGLLIDICLNR